MPNQHTAYLIMYFRSRPGGHLLTGKEIDRMVSCFYSLYYCDEDVFCSHQKRGEVIGIVYSGLFKCISQTGNNKTKVTDLIFPVYNDIVADWNNYIRGNAADKTIVSAKDSEVLAISHQDFKKLCIEIPFFNFLGQQLIYHSGLVKAELLKSYEGLDSKQKKNRFDTAYPGISKKLFNYEFCEYLSLGKNN